MATFFLLSGKLLPLYVLIVFGYLAAKRLHVTPKPIAALLIYIITPALAFYGTLRVPVTAATLAFPVFCYLLAATIGISAMLVARRFWNDGTDALMPIACGTGNNGYFGIPVAVALWGDAILSPLVLAIMAVNIFEHTLGVYFAARGQYSVRDALYKVARLPLVYAWLSGIAARLYFGGVPPLIQPTLESFVGAYNILGMMLIGLGLSQSYGGQFDKKLLSFLFAIRFLAWPLITGLIIGADIFFFGALDDLSRKALLLLGIVPLAANVVAWAAHFNIHPGRFATAVLLTTLTAWISIPAVITFLHAYNVPLAR